MQWRGGLSVTGGGGGGGANTQNAAPSPTRTHTNTHAAFLSEFLISLQGRMQDFGEDGMVSTWTIDASTTWRGTRSAQKILWCAF